MRNRSKYRERGISLVLVGLGLVMILGLAGISIDLASLYVTRNEEQRAADAAALAGANTFLTSGILIGDTDGATAAVPAETQAVQVGNANLVVGRSPGFDPRNFYLSCSSLPTNVSGGCFDFSNTSDPRITTRVYEKMPTYFMKIFGVDSLPVSATATAEAYSPTGSGPQSTAECLKPWMMPNCDYDKPIANPADPTDGFQANGYCPPFTASMDSGHFTGDYPSYFIYPQAQSEAATNLSGQPPIPTADLGTIVNPSLSPTGSIGELITVKAGDPKLAAAPSQFYPVFLPDPNPTFECPSCATSDQQNSTNNSAARYREYIECCSNTSYSCGTTGVSTISGVSAVTGNKVGPTGQGVDCLIHQGPGGTGQDTISWSTETDPTIPYTMYAGSLNGLSPTGAVITTSDSVVTVPIYSGAPLCPGGSCPSSINVDIQGWLQMFIKSDGSPQHTVDAYVLNISTCGGTTSADGSPTPIPSTTGSAIPVRLIHN